MRNALFSALAIASFAVLPPAHADMIYSYVGTPFTTCTFGTCPANFTSDYLIASFTLATPLAANLPLTDETSALTAWTLRDALGYFSYSSSSTPTYLTGVPKDGIPPLELSTDGSGKIVDYDMISLPDEVLGGVGFAEGGIVNPGVSCGTDCTAASFVEIDWGTPGEWDAITASPGQFAPEPATLALLGAGIVMLGLGKLKNGTCSRWHRVACSAAFAVRRRRESTAMGLAQLAAGLTDHAVETDSRQGRRAPEASFG